MSSDDQSNYKPNAISRTFEKIAKQLPSRERRAWIVERLRQNYLWVTVTVGLIAYLTLTAIVTWELPFLADAALEKLGAELHKDTSFDSNAVRNLAYAIAALLGGVALIAAVPFQLIKTWMNERQAITSEQGHITDRFTKAIGQLGEEKTVKIIVEEKDEGGVVREVTRERTEPNLEVRLGAIYALERIAQDSERDHIPIMETLAAYIRQNTKAEAPRDLNLAQSLPSRFPDEIDQKNLDFREREFEARSQNFEHWVASFGPLLPPRDDVRAVFRVIERRSAQRRTYERGVQPAFRIDLGRANFQRIDLSDVVLDHVDLSHSRMEGALLQRANLVGANLIDAKLQRADLSQAQLGGAFLTFADMEEAEFIEAKLEEANLRWAKMQGALFTVAEMTKSDLRGARLVRASLNGTNLEGADLGDAKLDGADLSGANLARSCLRSAWLRRSRMHQAVLKSADLKDCSITQASLRSANLNLAINLSQEAVNSAFGDQSTILPHGIERPYHWEGVKPLKSGDPGLFDLRKDVAYQAWLANYGNWPRPGEE